MCRAIFFVQREEERKNEDIACTLTIADTSYPRESATSLSAISTRPSIPVSLTTPLSSSPPPYPLEEEYPPSRSPSPNTKYFTERHRYMYSHSGMSEFKADHHNNQQFPPLGPPPSYNEEWENTRKKLKLWRKAAIILIILSISSLLMNFVSIISLWKISQERRTCGCQSFDDGETVAKFRSQGASRMRDSVPVKKNLRFRLPLSREIPQKANY